MASATITNEDGTTTVHLLRPVNSQGKLVESLTIKAFATVVDIEAMDSAKGDVAKTVAMIASMCNVKPSLVRSLDAKDFFRLSEVIQPFLHERQETGETSAET